MEIVRQQSVLFDMDRAQWRASGFTLIELLMIILSLATLSAMLLPAFAKAKARALSTNCRSNLRQLGVSLRMYLDDEASTFPYSESVPSANAKGTSYWFDALSSTVPNAMWGNGIFKCPANQGVVYEGGSTVDSRRVLSGVYAPCGSYAYNAAGRRNPALGPCGLVSAGLGFSISDGKSVEQPIRESDVSAPADLYAIGDAPLALAPWGEVPTMRWGGAADYNALLGQNATIDKTQHSATFNMLLADTHAESIRTEILLSTNAIHRNRWNHDHLP